MKTFDRYLLREWFQIIGVVVAALLGLLLVQVMYTDLAPLLTAGATFMDVTVYLAVAVPSFLALLMPLTLLVSLLYVFGQLHRNHEFTAMRASGVSLARISVPVWCVGVICCGLTLWLNSTIVPWSVEQSRQIRERVEFRHEAASRSADEIGARTSVAFDNRSAGRLWFMDRYSLFTHKAYGISLSFLDAQRRETRRIVASQAWRDADGKGWTFRDGRDYRFDLDSGEIVANSPFRTMTFRGVTDDPSLMLLIDRKPIDLSFWELRRLIGYLRSVNSAKAVPYEVRYFGLLADTLAPLIVIGLSVPFAVSGVRVNPAVGISKSIGLFALYYLLAQLGGTLAAKGVITPEWGAWLPSLGMSGLAFWFFLRLR